MSGIKEIQDAIKFTQKVIKQCEQIAESRKRLGIDYTIPVATKVNKTILQALKERLEREWISVGERLPKREEFQNEKEEYYRRLEIAYKTDTVEYKIGYFDGYKWFDKKYQNIENVVAWKLFEPYKEVTK
ncbi:MAG: hypothetical protein K0Q87_5031 [Neobacillus sp.]|jgi:hypothetical protein|nr:hypothetical protein [Neobacillus sp.]